MNGFVFPADRAKELRDSPQERYEFAIRYLPLPAAFREAAKGLRAIVRERKRNDEPYEDPLYELYRLACVRNLAFTSDPSREVQGILMNEPLPIELWQDVDFPYSEIGHEKLKLLGVRDRGRVEELWGEPKQHKCAWQVTPNVWKRFVEHDQSVRSRMEQQLQRRLSRIRSEATSKEQRSGCLVLLAIAVMGIITLLV